MSGSGGQQQQGGNGSAGGQSTSPQTTQQQQQPTAGQLATIAVANAVRGAMAGGAPVAPNGTGSALTDLAQTYMNAIQTANHAKLSGASAASVLPGAGQQGAAAAGGVGAAGGATVGAPGGMTWDPRLSYPTMMYMNQMNAMNNMPSLLALQQQQQQQRTMQQQSYNPLLDPSSFPGGIQNLLNGLDTRKSRHIKSPTQLKTLKQFFQGNQRPTKEEIRKLVKETNLPHQEVTRWFRNERHKEKKSHEAKMEGMHSGKITLNNPMGVHNDHLRMVQQQHMQQQAMKMAMKRKREDGGDDGGESDTGSDDNGEGARMNSFGLGGVNPPQRVAFIQSFIASLSDPTELEAAQAVLDAKRVALGVTQQMQDASPTLMNDAAWLVLQQQFHAASGKEAEAKRRKLGGKPDTTPATAQVTPNGLDVSIVQGFTQMFSKYPEYLKEVHKTLNGGGAAAAGQQ